MHKDWKENKRRSYKLTRCIGMFYCTRNVFSETIVVSECAGFQRTDLEHRRFKSVRISAATRVNRILQIELKQIQYDVLCRKRIQINVVEAWRNATYVRFLLCTLTILLKPINFHLVSYRVAVTQRRCSS
jgi:hypothetical protein